MSYFLDAFGSLAPSLTFVFRFAPVWAPVFLVTLFWRLWLAWRRALYVASKQPTLLEVRVPKEVAKSPLAMEVAMAAFYGLGGEATMKDRYWKGGVRPWFSLELVSLEGQVKFFIWTWKDGVKSIQNQLYAQYPQIEITEVPDYTMAFLYDPDKADIFAGELTLSKPDPYPIKTYIDYGLDKDPKEEFKIDPITAALEYLGGLGKGEQAWIQIIIRAHKPEDKKKGGMFAGVKTPDDALHIISKVKEQRKPTDKWKDDVKTEIEKIVKGRKIKGDDEDSKQITLTSLEKDTIAALERSITKLGFDAGVRFVYLAEKDYFNNANKGGAGGVFYQYNSPHLNGFKPLRMTAFPYKFKDPFGWRLAKMKRELFDAYRLRSWFHPPYKRKAFVLNAEELATIFHFPGGVAQTPTFGRIESRKAEPPVNLPV